MTPQAVAQLVDDLENSGNVARTPDPADGRARRVTLTERGRHALQVCEAILDEMAQEAADIVGAGRLGDTRRVLEELARHFDRAG
ncbi:MarR family winged helix-turn-helix transcriptional regulator [Leucobacter celer]|uniref:MarR family winged helix-turn-helix transcriptional regulator n=1 Tax=Leucobacter celer TaxID=668625 RepID=UPI0034CD43D5